MKTDRRNPLRIAALALMPAALVIFSSCSSTHKVEMTSVATYQEGEPGGTVVETYKITTEVTSIDAGSRKVTLVAPDGSKNTFTAGPNFRGFDQLKVGDEVQATVTRQLVVLLGQNGVPPSDDHAAALPVVPAGELAGVLRADTKQRNAKIGAVDPKERQVTLQFPDGTSKAFPARKDVDMKRMKVGDDVVIRTTSAVVLTPEKP
ncbi:MAG: hypothetical protein NT154_25540 [Verrucomicrobia bacterium]|nr:hypothetical protein [Verrucomicrobiota bacterium]